MSKTLTRDEICLRLQQRGADLRRLQVRSLRLFGSFVRGEAASTSEIDLLVEFEGKATLDRYMDAKFFLEELFDRSVDLVTVKALRPELKPSIEREAIRVA